MTPEELSRLRKTIGEDCLRGAMWQRKWRKTLEEYPDREELRQDAAFWRKQLGSEEPPALRIWEVDANPNGPSWLVGYGRVGLGTYGWKYNHHLVHRAIELKVPFIDTAETYGYGKVETELGKALKNYQRSMSVVPKILTKVARNHMSYTATLNAARRSRDRLGIPAISLYQIHWPHPKSAYGPTLDAMAKLIEEGTILNVGVCNFCMGQLAMVQKMAMDRGFVIRSNQVRINRSDQSALYGIVQYCAERAMIVIAHSPLGQGTLNSTGLEWLLEVTGLLEATGKMVAAIPGTNSLEHLEQNLRLNRFS